MKKIKSVAKQAIFTSDNPEERDIAMRKMRKSFPRFKMRPVGHTCKNDMHVNPYFVFRYFNYFRFPQEFINQSEEFPAFLKTWNLIEGVDIPKWRNK